MGASAHLSNPGAVEPGSEVSCEVRVRNTGQVVDQFSLEVLSDVRSWATVEPATLSLFPGAEGVSRIRFRPPRSSAIQAGSTPFAVRVQSREDPEGSVVEEGTLEVSRFTDAAAELTPRTSHGRWRVRHDLALDNRGNTRLEAQITATDPDKLLNLRPHPPLLTAAAGAAAFGRLQVQPRKRFLTGPPKTHAFKVQVQPDGQSPITLDGTMLQEAILPPWFMRAILGLLALGLLAAALWFALLKPTIQTAAKEAVAQLQNGSTNGGGGGTRGGGGSNPVTSPSPGTPLSVGATALGNPTDGHLDPKAATFLVPSSSTLSVTDLVLENPGAETGSLRLQRNSNDLLVVMLDNFRDLDYHFVAPLTFTGGQAFRLTVSCQNCRVYYAGYLKTSS